jgi:serine protease Do
MNTMKADAGIGFAVPSKILIKFVDDLKGRMDSYISGEINGRKRHYLGIKMFTINESTIDALFPRGAVVPPNTTGCFVVMVASGSPAEQAGLQRGDIIIRINDTDILDSTDIFKILETNPNLNMTVLRNGLEINLHVVADEIKS